MYVYDKYMLTVETYKYDLKNTHIQIWVKSCCQRLRPLTWLKDDLLNKTFPELSAATITRITGSVRKEYLKFKKMSEYIDRLPIT
jgi:hypothetical protein